MVISAFLARCDALAQKRGISRSRLSTLLFNDGKKLDALADGRDIGVLTLARVEKALEGLEASAGQSAGPKMSDAVIQ